MLVFFTIKQPIMNRK